jgi:hypothetical protein
MQRLSAERRKIVMLGGSMAGTYSVIRPYLCGHEWWTRLYLVAQLAVVSWMIVLLLRVRKNDCV